MGHTQQKTKDCAKPEKKDTDTEEKDDEEMPETSGRQIYGTS